MKTHKDLDIWKESIELVKMIYEITAKFPKEEIYGLTAQIRRCAISVPSNIAEGAARNSKKEFIQFLYIALGSLSELDTQLIISKSLGYLNKEHENLFEIIEKIKSKILGLIKYLRSQNA
ncbi:four helix bundle protein [Venenivibrio stagnispumantis]|uniref:Four helix bundle protein n=1 Tax=Venenivibrio stagnispumantis TaxID=407998 RepID=A0AA45WN68_9AQUI|nr:four helix bundle protein [Venenivibrio stagnispumantis]MCW4573204.1 four helix bundle protein [Venenivibrio stagnispumantis]SMP17412.1 four helix bundle protein [Venenivibrio stagnispumantis]